MKKQIITIGVIAILTLPNLAYCAGYIYCTTSLGGNSTTCPDCTMVTKTITCDTETYCDCSACKNNATPTSRTIQTGQSSYTTISECPKSLSGGDIIVVGTCPDECPDKTWTDVNGTNYQTRCGGSLKNPQCEYQCRPGFYGTNTSCTQCPPVDNKLTSKQYGTSSAGATDITECYLAPGTYYDTTGTFIISGDNCQYQH